MIGSGPAGLRSAFRVAWRVITDQRPRMLVAVGAITFAVLLIVLQLGFRSALLESALSMLDDLDADLVLVSADTTTLSAPGGFPRARLYQAQAVEGVAAARFVLVDSFAWKNAADRTERPIRVIGADPRGSVFLSPGIVSQVDGLATPGTALMDIRSREESYGPVKPRLAQVQRLGLEIIGTFELGIDFNVDGNLIVSEESFYRLSGRARKETAMIGLLRLAPGIDQARALAAVQAILPRDTVALTKEGLRDRELKFWTNTTPIAKVFDLGALVGFVVGILILYQLLFTLITDQLPQFATLKAIGYRTGYLVAVVFLLAGILATLGYGAGMTLASGLYAILGALTGLPFRLGLRRFVALLIMTAGMCAISGLVALRKVLAADPADVF